MPTNWLRARRHRLSVQRLSPALLVALLLVLATLNVLSSWVLFRHLRSEAALNSQLVGEIAAGLSNPEPGAQTQALFNLQEHITGLGVPFIVTDVDGRVLWFANLPAGTATDDQSLLDYARELDRRNVPVTTAGFGQIHYGSLPVSFRMAIIVALELTTFVLVLVVGFIAYRATRTSAQDRLWVAMARETAHQMGTPLMSLTGWIEHLRDGTMPASRVAGYLETDVELLRRVVNRFERIGRPARRELIGLGALAERVAGYYRPRLPKLANQIHLEVQAESAGPNARGDRVLLEWALEALVRNAVDALSGRGGHVQIVVDEEGGEGRVRVIDDGPGVPWEIVGGLFEPGVSSKTGGWGIGLALTKRIVEEQHDGVLTHEPRESGASFVMRLPIERTSGPFEARSAHEPINA